MVRAPLTSTRQLEFGYRAGRHSQSSPGPTLSASAAPAFGGARKSPCPACLVGWSPADTGETAAGQTRASLNNSIQTSAIQYHVDVDECPRYPSFRLSV